LRAKLLDPAIVVPPLLWLVSRDADAFNGRRLVAIRWRADLGGAAAAAAASEGAGWP
jgi:3-oxoacyl-[acyl-carrier protein] reductase